MDLKIQLFDLVLAFSRMLDRVMPELAGHHTRVGFFVDTIAKTLHVPEEVHQKAVIGGLLHDVGALPLRVSADDLVFERNREGHSIAGQRLLQCCPPLHMVAESVRYHHTPWSTLDPQNLDHRLGALLNLADRVDVYMHSVLNRATMLPGLRKHLQSRRGNTFCPLHVDAMLEILENTQFQERLKSATPLLSPDCRGLHKPVTMAEARAFSRFMGHVIDSRSPFTATHSVGVAHTACALAILAGMPQENMDAMYMAGMLHDIGKLDIPLRILEKPGPLTRDEAAIMSSHATLSEQWLDDIPGFDKVSRWGALHHERLNGSGYPHGYVAEQLEMPSRIMAVADVFTAITEDRPYRLGMPLGKAAEILGTMAKVHLDADLVRILTQNMNSIDDVRRNAQDEARCLYSACSNLPAEPIGDNEIFDAKPSAPAKKCG